MNLNKRWQHVLQGTVAVLSLALLTSCGGGKREKFQPGHMYMFGDEFSWVAYNSAPADFAHYSVNVVGQATPVVYEPYAYPMWSEYLAGAYGKTALPCSDASYSGMSTCAEPGSNVAAVITAINSKAFQKDELVVIMAGTHDILAAYRTFKSTGVLQDTQLRNLGSALGQRINTITDSGARVAVATIPDIGLSPYAIGEAGAANIRNYGLAMDCAPEYRPNPGEYSKALSYLTACFNSGLRGINGIKNDGKKIALISTFDRAVLIARSPSSYGIADAFNPACPTIAHSTNATYDPRQCYIDNVSTPSVPPTAVANPMAYLWSFGSWYAPGGHYLLGRYAIDQVNRNWGE